MLTTIGQGVALDAIVKLGFKNTHDDFDIARFFKRDDGGHELDLDVTFELVQADREFGLTSAFADGSPTLPPMVINLAMVLEKVGFKLLNAAEQFPAGKFTGRLRFTRVDRLKQMGRPLTTAVHVYAEYKQCIGPTTV